MKLIILKGPSLDLRLAVLTRVRKKSLFLYRLIPGVHDDCNQIAANPKDPYEEECDGCGGVHPGRGLVIFKGVRCEIRVAAAIVAYGDV